MKKIERKFEKKYKSLFEAVPDGVAFVDNNGIIREINQKACEFLECNKDDLIGKPLKEHPFYSGEEKEKFLKRADKVLRGEEVPPRTYELETMGGKKRYVEIKNSIIKENDEFQGLMLIGRDVTDRKEAEEEKEFLNTLLRQDLGIKCQTVEGYLQLIETTDFQEGDRESLERAMRAIREANEMVKMAEELREIKETESISRKNILKVLEHVIDSVSRLAEERGVRIEENYPDSIVKAKGDYSLNDLFLQILKTRIQTSNCDKIKLSADEMEEKIFVSVEDNGKPLPQKVKNIFSGKVYTGDTTGVGGFRYYMIRKIAEHNDATLEAEDSELGGARFEVYLNKEK